MTFVDRDTEQKHFLELLRCEDEMRLLTIKAKGGMGKSSLLQLYEDNCFYNQPRIPVSRVTLQDTRTYPSPWPFITKVLAELKMHGLEFPEFERLNLARLSGNFTPFAGGSGTSGYMHAPDSTNLGISGGVVQVTPIERADTVQIPPSAQLTSEQDEIAREKCIDAFFRDLKRSSEDRPVALLLDTWEKCNEVLKKWIERYLLPTHVFDVTNRPTKFVIVIAGQELPDFQTSLREAYARLVTSIGSFAEWDQHVVSDFLSAHGKSQFKDSDIEYLGLKIKEGWPLTKVLQMVDEYLQGS